MTTLAVRAQEQAIERRAAPSSPSPQAETSATIAREKRAREVAERIGGPLSPEQTPRARSPHRPRARRGPRRARRDRQGSGDRRRRPCGAARRTCRRSGSPCPARPPSAWDADSPALAGRTLTLDALVARANTGTHPRRTRTRRSSSTRRGWSTTSASTRSPSWWSAPGRSWSQSATASSSPRSAPAACSTGSPDHAPTAELADIHRTKDPAEQRAWQALRAGEPERAMAHYASRGQLHLSDTRDQAAEHAVQTWATLTRGRAISARSL